MERITALLIHPIALSMEGRRASWVRKFPKGTKKTQRREHEKNMIAFLHLYTFLGEILNVILFHHMIYQKEN